MAKKYYINPNEIVSVEYNDGIFQNKLTILFKNGEKQIRKESSSIWHNNLYEEYKEILNELK